MIGVLARRDHLVLCIMKIQIARIAALGVTTQILGVTAIQAINSLNFQSMNLGKVLHVKLVPQFVSQVPVARQL